MLLVIDAGNTNVTLGVFRGSDLLAQWRLTTDHDRSSDAQTQCGLTDPDVAAVGIERRAAAVGSRRRRPLEADARVVEFLDKRPARVCFSSSSTCLRNSGRLKAEVAERRILNSEPDASSSGV